MYNKLNPSIQISPRTFVDSVPFYDYLGYTSKPPAQTDKPATSCGDACALTVAMMISKNFQATGQEIKSGFATLKSFGLNQTAFDKVRPLMAALAFAVDPNCFQKLSEGSRSLLKLQYGLSRNVSMSHSASSPKRASDSVGSVVIDMTQASPVKASAETVVEGGFESQQRSSEQVALFLLKTYQKNECKVFETECSRS